MANDVANKVVQHNIAIITTTLQFLDIYRFV